MENKEMAEPDGNSTSVEWCRVVPMVSSNKDSRGGQGRPKEFTILRANSRSRLSLAYDSRGRDWLVLSRSPANWLLPSSSQTETLIVELRARDTVKFYRADKGAIQIKRSPFPPLPSPFTCPPATLPFPSPPLPPRHAAGVLILLFPSAFLSATLISLFSRLYFAPPLLSEAAAFLPGRSAPPSLDSPTTPRCLSYIACTGVTTEE